MEQIKLTPEEVDQLSEIKNTQESLVISFGEIEYSIQSLEIQKDKIVENLTTLKQNEVELGKSLQQKYGEGSIDLESGVFTKKT